MPKISKNNVTLNIEGLSESFEIIVMYNQSNLFYSVMPEQFNETLKCVDSKISEEHNLCHEYTSSRREYKRFLVLAETEHKCLELTKKIYKYCLLNTTKDKNVIIMFYNGDKTIRYNNHLYNSKHPQIGIQIGLTYAIETSLNERKIYYQVINEIKKELSLWNESATIIDDTPENRIVLEDLYEKMNTLNNKLKEFTSSSESLKLMIHNKVKLLK